MIEIGRNNKMYLAMKELVNGALTIAISDAIVDHKRYKMSRTTDNCTSYEYG